LLYFFFIFIHLWYANV